MKKFIVASLCTLGLTLLGTFGTYQNLMTFPNGLNTAYASTSVQQNNLKTTQTSSNKKVIVKKYKKKNCKKLNKKAKSKINSNVVKGVSTKGLTNKNTDSSKSKSAKEVVTQNSSDVSSYANQVLKLVNQERAKAGLSALTTNSTITAAANKRAKETVQSFSHIRPDGTSFSSVLKEYSISYRAAGENIAYGQKTPQEVVTAWMNSPGHRANIMNTNFGKLGVGVYKSNGVIYWSQLFTN